MSSRQLRKLQQRKELQAQAELQEANEDSGEEDQQPSPVAKSKASLFATLADLKAEDEDEEDGGKLAISEDNHLEEDSAARPEATHVARTLPPMKSSKKKKKKGKGRSNKSPKLDAARVDLDEDDIDAVLKELAIETRGKTVSKEEVVLDHQYETTCRLLAINSHQLGAANEMKNLFGPGASGNHDDAGGQAGSRRDRRRMQEVDLETALKGHHAPGRGLPESTLKRNIFIQGKDHWPKATSGGLTMQIVDTETGDGTIEYKFVHDRAYNAVQQEFGMFVEMGEPSNLISLLQRNPYNVALLLQVSKIAKDQADHSLSNDLIERALFTFARVSLSSFSTTLSQGKARLDFARPENRELWLAGYHYIKSLMMKGTYRTALEWAKLLLSLDPKDDPYCMRLMIHQLAVRAHEYGFLLELGQQPFMNWESLVAHCRPSLALAAMRMKQSEKARLILQDCVGNTPWLFCKLFQELNLNDLPPSIWGIVPRNDTESLFTDIYIRQMKDHWNTPDATSLLNQVAQAMPKMSLTAEFKSNIVSLAVARWVYLDNTPSTMALVPSSLMHRTPNSDSDPLPPNREFNSFSWPNQQRSFVMAADREDRAGMFDGLVNPIEAIRALMQNPPHLFEETGDVTDDWSATDEADSQEQTETNDDAHEVEAAAPTRDHEPEQGGFLSRAISGFLGYMGAARRRHETSDEDEDTDVDDYGGRGSGGGSRRDSLD